MAAPDFVLTLSSKEPPPAGKKRYYSRVGAAWKAEVGRGISLILEPGVVLDGQLLRDYYLNLYPNDDKTSRRRDGEKAPAGSTPLNHSEYSEADFPKDDDGYPPFG
jgi:hypothetical protein